MPNTVNTATKDGTAWRIGNDEDVAWVKENRAPRGCTITVAIPAVFADYATLLHPGEPDAPRDVEEEARQDRALLTVLQRHNDDWTCIGGPATLIADLLRDPQLARHARRIKADQEATPPEARQR